MKIIVDSEIELKQLEQSDSSDIFNTINNQREHLGKWLPFVAFTKELSDTEVFVNSVVNAPKDRNWGSSLKELKGKVNYSQVEFLHTWKYTAN